MLDHLRNKSGMDRLQSEKKKCNKILNNFTVTHCIVIKFSSHITGSPAGYTRTLILEIHFTFYAFSRRFYPKRLTLHSSYSFYILSALAFPGNRTHDLGVASTMLYQLSYRKARNNYFGIFFMII